MPQKILVIEDDPDVRDILQVRLGSAGYEVITAPAGLDGLKTVYRESPDLIILDLMLPQLDGFQLCRILKFDERYRDIPIMMLTAKTEHKSIQLGLKAGANKYLTKPFEPEQVVSEAHKLLDKTTENK